MSDRNKNMKINASEFSRYKQGEMTGEERNAFERELQKDPFAYEAAEGLESLSAEEITADISVLGKRIRSKTEGRRRFAYYSIAASVAVLMVISSIYIIINKSNISKQTSENAVIEKPAKTDERSLPVVAENQKSGEEPAKSENKKRKEEMKHVTLAYASQGAGGAAGTETAEKAKDAVISVPDSISQIKTEDIYASVSEMQAAAPIASRSAVTNTGLFKTAGRILSSEDNMPVPGAVVSIKGTNTSVMTDTGGNFTMPLPDSSSKTLVARFIGMESKEFTAKADSREQIKLDPDVTSLSEVVVVGYGVRKGEYDDAEAAAGYTAPQPSIGKSAFNKYIEDNIRRPDTLPAGQRVVVIVNVTVHADGSLGEIKIVRSPRKSFSNEAVRLIKSWPEWKPAIKDGKVIEDEVKVRIVFR
jgi:TonB family protein